MNDIDLLYDYYKDNTLSASGYATLATRAKDDRLEKIFMEMSQAALVDARKTANLIISLGGTVI